MANERQFFRDINPGDVSIEGRKSNGITADINGNTIIYGGIKQNELQKLNQDQYIGNIPIDGYTSTFIAALAPGQLPPYPEGNNNNETYFDDKQTDPNKITVTSFKDIIFDPCKNKNVLIVGDSITADAGFTWSSQYKKNQTDKNVKILAIPGKQLITWMKPELEKELKVNKYDTVIIYGGVNDAFSSKTSSQIIKGLQSIVDNVKNNGAQAIVITGYDAEKDMDVNKMPTTRYVRTADEYKPLLEEYKKFQSSVNTITGALIIPKKSIGILNDGFHPSGAQAKLLYEHIIANIPKCDGTKVTQPSTQTITPLPSFETKTPPPAPKVDNTYVEEFEFLKSTVSSTKPTQITEVIEVDIYQFDKIDPNGVKLTGRKLTVGINNNDISNTDRFGKDKIKTALNFFTSKGFTKAQASGIVGALCGESSLDPTEVNSIGATGIAQWLGKRREKLKTKSNWETFNTQLNFIWEEMQSTEKKAYDLIKQTTTAAEAAVIYEDKFERPGKKPENEKFWQNIQKYANDIFKKY